MTRTSELVGRRVGPYEVEAVVNDGGMSTLYRANDVRVGRTVALKVMSDALAGDAEFRERFVEEARITSTLDHPNVVPLHDFGDAGGRLFLALRYVEGHDLSTVLAAGPMEPMRALAVLAQVARALDALHTRGLVHLDVKPGNILLTQPAGTGTDHAYLTDFGLTRAGVAGAGTRSGDFLGSPDYAAPEHLRGHAVDARTDVYSLACVLYTCLTGSAPRTGTLDDVIAAHLAGAVLAGIPGPLGEVVGRGMSLVPAERFPTCTELVAAARRAVLAGGGVVIPPMPRRPSGLTGSAPTRTGPSSRTGPSRTGQSTASPHGPGAAPTTAVATTPPGAGVEPDVAAMRLRPPLPADSGSVFTAGPASRPWMVPVAVLVVLALVIAVVVLLL